MQERDMKANELDGASRSEYSKVIWMRNEGRFPKKTFRQEVDEANRRNDLKKRKRLSMEELDFSGEQKVNYGWDRLESDFVWWKLMYCE